MTKPKVISVANQKVGVGKSTTIHRGRTCAGRKESSAAERRPPGQPYQGLGYAGPMIFASVMNDVVSGAMPHDDPGITHHRKDFDFVPGNRSLSTAEVGLVNVMSREMVLRQYVDSVKQG